MSGAQVRAVRLGFLDIIVDLMIILYVLFFYNTTKFSSAYDINFFFYI